MDTVTGCFLRPFCDLADDIRARSRGIIIYTH